MEFLVFLAIVIGLTSLVVAIESRKRVRNLENTFQYRIMLAERKLEDLHRRLKLVEGLKTQPKDTPATESVKESVTAKTPLSPQSALSPLPGESILGALETASRETEKTLSDEKQRLFESLQEDIRQQQQKKEHREPAAPVPPLSNQVGKDELAALLKGIPAAKEEPKKPVEPLPFLAEALKPPPLSEEPIAAKSEDEKHDKPEKPREKPKDPPRTPSGNVPPPSSAPSPPKAASYSNATKAKEKEREKESLGERYKNQFSEDAIPSQVPGDSASLANLELLLGRKVMGWVAAAAMVLAAVIVIKLTAERITIPEFVRVLGIGVLGLTLIGFGYRYYRLGWQRFSTMLTSTGIVISFIAGYASFGYFELLSRYPAMLLMSGIVLGCFLLAYFYNSTLLGIHAILGGLLVPLLIGGSGESYPQLFTYLFLLNLGTVLLLNTLHRVPLGLLAMFGTQLEFFLWFYAAKDFQAVTLFVHGLFGEVPFGRELEPVQIAVALGFQGAFYLLYLLDTSIGTISTRFRTSWDDTVRAILAPIIMFAWVYVLLYDVPVLSGYMGVYAFIGALWYALLRRIYIALTEKRRLAECR